MTRNRHKEIEPSPRPARGRVAPVLLGVGDAAAALSIGRGTLYQLLKAGDIRAAKIGSRTLLSVAELRRFAERLTSEGGAR